MMKKVMVVIDETKCSYNALIWALENLKESLSEGSPLFIFATQPLSSCNFAVTPFLGYAHLYCSLPPTWDIISLTQERTRETSMGLLEKAKTICSNRGVCVKTITEVGDPKEAICKAIEDNKINLLIVGDNPNGFFKRAFFGSSLAEYCLSNAKCSVLVVKNSEEAA